MSAGAEDDADALWERFKSAADEVQARCDDAPAAVLAEQSRPAPRDAAGAVREGRSAGAVDRLDRHRRHAEAAAGASGTLGRPESQGRRSRSPELARRFRTACDTFFTRRKTDLAAAQAGVGAELAEEGSALRAHARRSPSRPSGPAAFTEIKQLQAEWKTVGPVRENRSEAAVEALPRRVRQVLRALRQAPRDRSQSRVQEREAICRRSKRSRPARRLPRRGGAPRERAPAGVDAAAPMRGGRVAEPGRGRRDACADRDGGGAAPAAGVRATAEPVQRRRAADAAVAAGTAVTRGGRAAVEEAWRRWRQSPGLPSDVLVPVRARFESALTTVMTTHAAALQGTVLRPRADQEADEDAVRRRRERRRAACPRRQLGSSSVVRAGRAAEGIARRQHDRRPRQRGSQGARRRRQGAPRAETVARPRPGAGTPKARSSKRASTAPCRRFFERHPQFDAAARRPRGDRSGPGGAAHGGGERRGDRARRSRPARSGGGARTSAVRVPTVVRARRA